MEAVQSSAGEVNEVLSSEGVGVPFNVLVKLEEGRKVKINIMIIVADVVDVEAVVLAGETMTSRSEIETLLSISDQTG